MNWDAIGAIGEIVGAAAVVVSIAYLAIQIRSNTRATKASASFEATHSWATSNELVHQMSDEVLLAFRKSYTPDATPGDLSDAERIRVAAHVRALFQKLEGQYYLYRYGFLDPDVWAKRSAWAHGFIELPFWQDWWQNELRELIFSDDFVEAVEAAPVIHVSLVGAHEPVDLP